MSAAGRGSLSRALIGVEPVCRVVAATGKLPHEALMAGDEPVGARGGKSPQMLL